MPPKGIPLSGLFHRNPKSSYIGIQECRMKIVWLSTSEKESLVFLLADYLFFPDKLANLCYKLLEEKYNVPRSNVVFAGTHNHSGPALGFLPWESEQPNYLKEVFEKIKTSIPSLKSNLQPAKLSIGNAVVKNININRRKPIRHWRRFFKQIAFMLPNANGPVNKLVRGVKIELESSKNLLLLSFASHPVFNRTLKISSDYPGLLSARLIENSIADEVLVFQGFGGDIRPNYQGRKEVYHQFKALFYGKDFADYKPAHSEHFVDQLSSAVQNISWEALHKEKAISISTKEITLRTKSKLTKSKLIVRKIDLSKKLNFITANAEMFVQYENGLPNTCFPISCLSHCIGYVPAVEDLPLGGYEVDEAPLNNNLDGAYCEEDVLKVESAMKEIITS